MRRRGDGKLSGDGSSPFRAWLRARPRDLVVAVIGCAATMLAAAAVVTVRVTQPQPGTIPAGVSIEGVPVGGLTSGEAQRALVGRVPLPSGPVRLVTPDDSRLLTAVSVKRLRPRALTRRAVEDAARPAGLVQRIRRELGLGGVRDVPVTFRVDAEEAQRVAIRAARRLDRPPRPAAARVEGRTIVLRAAVPGRAVDRPALIRRLAELPGRLVVPVDPVVAPITDAQARIARVTGLRIVSSPVTVVGGRRRAEIARQELLRALRFRIVGARLEPRLDPATIRRLLLPAFSVVERSPRSARFRARGRRVEVVDARSGRRIDGAAVARAIESGRGAQVRLRTAAVQPALTTRRARSLGIREVVGEFSTPYACCQPRVVNIVRAASILDGTVIPSGATFSLNDALGERTSARGFVPAPQINAGRLEDAIGGGVSQVATTFFNAAFFAGLRIVTHTPHEFWITRYPPGREATISWGGPELIVRNDWAAAILLTVIATDDRITVRLFSSREGRRVTTETIGTPSAGSAFSVAYTRRVERRSGAPRVERFSWTYRAPPPA